MKTWLTEKEVSEYTGLHRHTIAKLRDKGTPQGIYLPASKLGRIYRYKREDVDEFLEQHKG